MSTTADPRFESPNVTRVRRPRNQKGAERKSKVDLDSSLGQYIPIHYHGQMLAQETRVGAFRESIAKLVPEGGTVVELGGGTGILSFFAAKRARKVYCVERIPHVADAARRFLANNGVGDRVEVIEADAMRYLPDEPVDAVICEMLHSGLLREKQLAVIDSFKRRYLEKFGGPLPRFIPEAMILAAQLVYFPYDFQGFRAQVPMFRDPHAIGDPTFELGEADVYSIFEYEADLPKRFDYERSHSIVRGGTLNAVRFVTKNIVAILADEGRSIDWHMHYLCMPLPAPIEVSAGDEISLRFSYEPGDSILTLGDSLVALR